MRNIQLTIVFILLLIFPISAQEFRKVQDGIEYAQFTRPIKIADKEKAQTTVNALRLDLTKVRLDVFHALDEVIGVETTSSIATRHDAIAAINGGFFRLDKSIFNGDPAGILQIDGKLLSDSVNNRIALGIINDKDRTETVFGHLETDIWVTIFTDIVITLSGINRERKQKEIILYTPEFHRTTLTNSEGSEIIIKKCCPSRENEFVESKGGTLIPVDGMVLSVSKDSYKLLVFRTKEAPQSNIFIGSENKVIETEKEKAFAEAEDIVGGVPQLIKNGKIEITWEQEKQSKLFVETHHPRTAVAKLKDGKFLMVTIDGRSESSGGMSLQELAEMLLEMGAIDAMNLDGGGSTTMFLDGKIVNRPSDKEGERAVSDAILVFPRAKK